jgi:DNA-binding PadR family transcriptional regulator
MNAEFSGVDAAIWAGVTILLAGFIIAILLPERVRNRLRRHRSYRIAERGWARLRKRRQAVQDGQRFRNLQARFLSCIHRPKEPPPGP